MNSNFLYFKISYFMLYFAMASYYPMLGKYYKDLGFSGAQIGILFSAATLVTLIVQPLWGIISDKMGNCKTSFKIMHIAIIFIALIFPFITSYKWMLIFMSIHFIFQCGLFPILDTMIYKDVYDFGHIRLWGSIGFAVMVLFSGKISEKIGINNMFYLYSFLMIVSLFFGMKIIEKSNNKHKKHERSSIKKIFKPNYIYFLLMGFFTYGAFSTGGQYFSILFTELGGSMKFFGITYFFIAFSEVPFLRISQKLVKKFGAEKMILFSGFLVLFRFGLNSLANDYRIILYTSIFMGSFIGVVLPAAAVFLKENIDEHNRAKAVTIYSSISTGLGPMIFQYGGGILYEKTNISLLYVVLCGLIIVGTIFSYKMYTYKKNQNKHILKI